MPILGCDSQNRKKNNNIMAETKMEQKEQEHEEQEII